MNINLKKFFPESESPFMNSQASWFRTFTANSAHNNLVQLNQNFVRNASPKHCSKPSFMRLNSTGEVNEDMNTNDHLGTDINSNIMHQPGGYTRNIRKDYIFPSMNGFYQTPMQNQHQQQFHFQRMNTPTAFRPAFVPSYQHNPFNYNQKILNSAAQFMPYSNCVPLPQYPVPFDYLSTAHYPGNRMPNPHMNGYTRGVRTGAKEISKEIPVVRQGFTSSGVRIGSNGHGQGSHVLTDLCSNLSQLNLDNESPRHNTTLPHCISNNHDSLSGSMPTKKNEVNVTTKTPDYSQVIKTVDDQVPQNDLHVSGTLKITAAELVGKAIQVALTSGISNGKPAMQLSSKCVQIESKVCDQDEDNCELFQVSVNVSEKYENVSSCSKVSDNEKQLVAEEKCDISSKAEENVTSQLNQCVQQSAIHDKTISPQHSAQMLNSKEAATTTDTPKNCSARGRKARRCRPSSKKRQRRKQRLDKQSSIKQQQQHQPHQKKLKTEATPASHVMNEVKGQSEGVSSKAVKEQKNFNSVAFILGIEGCSDDEEADADSDAEDFVIEFDETDSCMSFNIHTLSPPKSFQNKTFQMQCNEDSDFSDYEPCSSPFSDSMEFFSQGNPLYFTINCSPVSGISTESTCQEDDNDELKDRLKHINAQWSVNVEFHQESPRQKKVHFVEPSQLVKVQPMITWAYAYQAARKGPWEQCARDRERFSNRIKDTESKIAHCLTPAHRDMIYKKYVC